MNAPARRNGLPGLAPWKWALLPLMAAVILLCYLWVPAARGFQEADSARIIFWHVPMAILSMVWFFVAAFHGTRYLAGGQPFDDTRSSKAAEMGLLTTLLATVTGAVFSKMQWGGGFNTPWYHGYWQWDPQQTAITLVILIFMAYFGLRMSVEDPRTCARLSAVYVLLAAAAVPFLYYVLPKLPALGFLNHPTGQVLFRGEGMSLEYRITFWLSTAAFLGLTAWAYQLQLRFARVEERRFAAEGATEAARIEAVRRPAAEQ